MSHIRSTLSPDNRLYQSTVAPILPPTSGTATDPPVDTLAPAARITWQDSFRVVLTLLRTWRARQRARRALAAIDAHTLRDIGIAPELVAYELSQPFWRPLRDWRD